MSLPTTRGFWSCSWSTARICVFRTRGRSVTGYSSERSPYVAKRNAGCEFLYYTTFHTGYKLGHGHIGTTSRYLHLISPQFAAPKEGDPLDLLARLPRV